MFGDQTRSNIVWLPNMLMLNLVAKRCEICLTKERSNPRNKRYLWIQVKERALNACVRKNVLQSRPNKQNVLQFLIKCLTLFKFYQTQPNTIQQHQTRCPNGKMFGHQTMFEHVWSPNISRLDRVLSKVPNEIVRFDKHTFSPVTVFCHPSAQPRGSSYCFDGQLLPASFSDLEPVPLSDQSAERTYWPGQWLLPICGTEMLVERVF